MDAIVATREWLEQFVIGLNLCPFAGLPFRKGQIRYVVEEGDTLEQLVNTLLSELAHLYETPAEQVETTLIIFPNVLLDFFAYNDFLGFADDLLEEAGLTGVFQIASFHPDYRFEGESDKDPANYTNRSPFPMLHLLREDSLSQALDRYPEPERIPERNIVLLRQMGTEEILERYPVSGARRPVTKDQDKGKNKEI